MTLTPIETFYTSLPDKNSFYIWTNVTSIEQLNSYLVLLVVWFEIVYRALLIKKLLIRVLDLLNIRLTSIIAFVCCYSWNCDFFIHMLNLHAWHYYLIFMTLILDIELFPFRESNVSKYNPLLYGSRFNLEAVMYHNHSKEVRFVQNKLARKCALSIFIDLSLSLWNTALLDLYFY